MPSFDIVIPTCGRPSLARMLEALLGGGGPQPGRILVVDDRAGAGGTAVTAEHRTTVVRSGGRGPAAARNAGLRACTAEWVAFLDDDVVPPPGWRAALARDLAACRDEVAGCQGRVRVPRPAGRRPTDAERTTIGLEGASWATADMAYRRTALLALGGFDERFPRAYREDADLAVRALRAGHELAVGERWVEHPAAHGPAALSVRKQAGAADDALMRALHGPRWRVAAGAPRGRLPLHVLTVAAAGGAAGAALAGRRRAAGALGAAWLALAADFARVRIAPGPRSRDEIVEMAWTSAVIPFAAVWHRARGELRARRLVRGDRDGVPRAAAPPAAVLFDRDGTLVHDVPYNGDPARVAPVPGARAALDRLRAAGVPLGVVSNQSGIARGLLTAAQVEAVNARIEADLGPFGVWTYCPHGPDDGCECRKPAPGLVLRAAAALGVPPERCAVVGDIGADVEAARAAGARGVLVPTAVTRAEEVAAAPEVAATLEDAVERLLEGRP